MRNFFAYLFAIDPLLRWKKERTLWACQNVKCLFVWMRNGFASYFRVKMAARGDISDEDQDIDIESDVSKSTDLLRLAISGWN